MSGPGDRDGERETPADGGRVPLPAVAGLLPIASDDVGAIDRSPNPPSPPPPERTREGVRPPQDAAGRGDATRAREAEVARAHDRMPLLLPPHKEDGESNRDERAGEGRGDGDDEKAHEKRHEGGQGEHGGASVKGKRWLFALGGAAVVVAAVVVFVLTLTRHHRESNERSRREKDLSAGPVLAVQKVEVSSGDRELTLPGDVRAYQLTEVYAKISGYLKAVYVDRGDRVKRGQVLGILESPDYDQQVAAAKIDLGLKKRIADRARYLARPGVVSAQELDTAQSEERTSQSNLERIGSLAGYELVRAPFDGVVTQRYADNGALLPAATGSTQSALPLVEIAEIDKLRVYVFVGQDSAAFLHVGDPVELWQDEMPEKVVHASVSRTASALDLKARTLQVEVDIDNRPYGILPGTFVHVRLHMTVPPSPAVPAEALVFRQGEVLVGLVDQGHVHFVPVETGYNDGKRVRITRGLKGGETVAIQVPTEVPEGAAVRPVAATPPAGGSASAVRARPQPPAGASGNNDQSSPPATRQVMRNGPEGKPLIEGAPTDPHAPAASSSGTPAPPARDKGEH